MSERRRFCNACGNSVDMSERRYRLKEDDERFGLKSGDVLICIPYFYEHDEKLSVIRRESDGFDPDCNVYRAQVERIT